MELLEKRHSGKLIRKETAQTQLLQNNQRNCTDNSITNSKERELRNE